MPVGKPCTQEGREVVTGTCPYTDSRTSRQVKPMLFSTLEVIFCAVSTLEIISESFFSDMIS